MDCHPLALASLHAAARSKRPATEVKQLEETRRKAVAKSRLRFKNQFGPAIQQIEDASLDTLEEGELAVEDALDVMNQLRPTDDVKQRLVLADSALGSSLSANKQLISVVGQAQKDAGKKMPTVVDLLQHYCTVLVLLVDEISNQRVAVALAREEISAYNAELQRHSKCGVLCAPIDAVPAALTLSTVPAGGGMQRGKLLDDENATSKASARKEKDSGASGGKREAAKAVFAAAVSTLSNQTSAVTSLTTHLAETTTRSATELVKRTAHNVVSSTTELGVRVAGGGGSGSVGGSFGVKTTHRQVGLAYDDRDKIDGSHFSQDEAQLYKVQNELILQNQHSADLKAAKEVEASVQQLSQLNALVSERVFAQSEQLNLVEKNTDDAKGNIQEVAKELKKPLSARWNSKRMQIAFVWLNILVLLFLHWLIR